mmetsp:Transcript_57644/g.126299  ORF Transcript_57644/g.126299 Transcript_57644/m.126299 type:complete len:231 (-) Transcript_57644:69-761(-)
MARLGGPAQEVHDILGHLGLGARSAVLVVDQTIRVERRRHADEATREVGVVVEPVTDREAGGRVTVAHQHGEDVVDTLVLGGGVDRQIRGEGTTVRISGGLLVGVRRRESIDQEPRSGEHLALVVGSIDDVDLGGKLLHSLLRIDLADQVPEMQLVHGMAGSADLPVDLVSSAHARNLVGVEDGLDPERIARGVGGILVLALHGGGSHSNCCRGSSSGRWRKSSRETHHC